MKGIGPAGWVQWDRACLKPMNRRPCTPPVSVRNRPGWVAGSRCMGTLGDSRRRRVSQAQHIDKQRAVQQAKLVRAAGGVRGCRGAGRGESGRDNRQTCLQAAAAAVALGNAMARLNNTKRAQAANRPAALAVPHSVPCSIEAQRHYSPGAIRRNARRGATCGAKVIGTKSRRSACGDEW